MNTTPKKRAAGKMMQLTVGEIKPNEFKKEIDDGKFNEKQVESLMSNMEELGLMGALPIYQKDEAYRLVNGHHRLEALKRVYGKDYKIPVVLHDYDQETVLRGMIIENLTQRQGEFREEVANLALIRKWLQQHKTAVHTLNSSLLSDGRKAGPQHQDIFGSVRDIASWLNKTGKEVMSIGKIQAVLSINDRLAPELKEEVIKKTNQKGGEGLGVDDAYNLSRFESYEEQKDLAKALQETREQNHHKKNANLTAYKKAPEEVKAKVRSGELDLADVPVTIQTEEFKQKAREIKESPESEIKLVRSKEIIAAMRSDILDTQRQLDKMMVSLRAVRHTKFYFYKAEEKQNFFKLVRGAHEKAQRWNEELEKLIDDLELEVIRE